MQKSDYDINREKNVNQLVRESGLKATGSRAKILRVLSNAKKPLRIKDIFDRVQGIDDEINMVTIYRTIEAFVKKGLVHRVDFGENAAYYELHDTKHGHNYITCTECRRHDIIDGSANNNINPEIKSKLPNYQTIAYHSVEYFGVCTACNEKLADKYQKVISKEFVI